MNNPERGGHFLDPSSRHGEKNGLLRLPNNLIHRFGRILDIPRIESGHADPSVLSHVDMSLLSDPQHLRLRQAREAEHADLIRDVLPAPLAAVEGLQLGAEGLAHVLDAAAHRAQVGFPLGEEGRVVEHGAGDAGAVRGRVADLAALQDGQLGTDAADGGGGVRAGAGDEVEGTGTLAVEAEVFGEGLGDAELEGLGDEVADGPGVVFEVAGGEALVGAVEEGEVLLGADGFGELDPLVVGEVHPGRVVGAGVQQDDASGRGLFDGREHPGEI